MRKQAKEKTRYWIKLSDTLLQCLKGLSSQKDGTRIRTTIDLWYDHGQDPAMLAFFPRSNEGALQTLPTGKELKKIEDGVHC